MKIARKPTYFAGRARNIIVGLKMPCQTPRNASRSVKARGERGKACRNINDFEEHVVESKISRGVFKTSSREECFATAASSQGSKVPTDSVDGGGTLQAWTDASRIPAENCAELEAMLFIEFPA